MNESGNKIYYAALLVLAFTFYYDNTCAQALDTSTRKTQLKPVSFKGIKGRIFDAATETFLPARIVITDDTGHVYNSYYSKLPGFFTEEDGSFQLPLRPGKYTLEVFRGIDYLSQKMSFQITSEKGVEVNNYLHQWYPLKKEGWYSGDGHDHLYTENKPDTAMIRLVRKICLAQGIDFVVAAQGWAGYNDSTWRDGYSKFSDKRFVISYGSEMPKYRTGHTWYLGQKSTRSYFDETMDTVYENQYYQADTGTSWTFENLPLTNIPDVEVVQRFKNADSSLAIIAHPTSWWMQKRGNIEKYVTNVTASLAFGLLSGKIWDGLVVMGYDHDHYFYQNLWFNVLNKGYRMPAFSELDGGLGKEDKFYYGSMRTYFKMDGDFTIEKLITAAREGKSFMTSGPIINTDIDNKYFLGDVIAADGKKHVLDIDAYASGESDDKLSYVIVFRNGKIAKLWDLRKDNLRKFKGTLTLHEKDNAWYVVKVYGKNSWQSNQMLDVMRIAQKNATDSIEYREGENDVAITNPFYFRKKGQKEPAVLQSQINLMLNEGSSKINNASIEIMVAGKTTKKINIFNGTATFSMPVNGILKISTQGKNPVYRSLYLDYLPHQKILEEIASGRWRNKYEGRKKFNPGEIPWEEFHFEKAKAVLTKVNWTIDITPNSRDAQWPVFDALFRN